MASLRENGVAWRAFQPQRLNHCRLLQSKASWWRQVAGRVPSLSRPMLLANGSVDLVDGLHRRLVSLQGRNMRTGYGV